MAGVLNNMIERYNVFDKEIYINSANSNFSYNIFDLNYEINTINFDEINVNFSDFKSKTLTICINISDACNLKCDYCFNPNKKGKFLSVEKAVEFIENTINEFDLKEKYYIDLSGKGEPLLCLDSILKINKFCKRKSNEINREILVSFVSNGVLLNEDVAECLQKNGILFGVSLDGNQIIHDKHRKTKDNENTFEIILNNVKKIKNHEYVGCAVTITQDVFDLLSTELYLLEIFNTISVKPVRLCSQSFTIESVEAWKKEYNKLTLYIIDKALRFNDIKLLKALLNGNDYFGKFIIRAFLGTRCIVRCDAGLSRFTLDTDGSIFGCPSAFGNESLQIGNNGLIKTEKLESIFMNQIDNNDCNMCSMRYFCGGECVIEKTLNSMKCNQLMCIFKKHLILLSVYLNLELQKNRKVYMDIYNFCSEVLSRFSLDKELEKFLSTHKEYSFCEGKKIFDQMNKKY